MLGWSVEDLFGKKCQTKIEHTSILLPLSLFLAEARGDSSICLLSPHYFPVTGLCPAKSLPLNVPHATRPSIHRVCVALSSGRISINAIAPGDMFNGEGVFTWRMHRRSSNAARRSRLHFATRPSFRHRHFGLSRAAISRGLARSIRLTAPLLTSKSSTSPATDPLISPVKTPPVAVVRFTDERRAKVSLRKNGSQHTLSACAEDTHLGSLNFNMSPSRRLSAGLLLRDPLHSLSQTPLLSMLAKPISFLVNGRAAPLAEAITTPSGGIITSAPFPNSTQSHRTTQARNVSTSHQTRLRVDLEYGVKENRWTFQSGLEGERRELSAKLSTRPIRIVPRIRIPTSGPKNASWIQWTHRKKSFLGEVELGWRTFTLAHAWTEKSFRISRALPSGTNFSALINEKRIVKLDSTIVAKPLKGSLSLAVNSSVASDKGLNSASVTLGNPFCSLFAFVKQDRSCGAMFESNLSSKNQTYRVAVKMDDFKSASIRLGLFY